MGYTSEQHRTARVYAALGYKQVLETVSLSEFSVGEGIIILNKNGEPMMSGVIDNIQTEDDGSMSVVVGEYVWDESTYIFRRM